MVDEVPDAILKRCANCRKHSSSGTKVCGACGIARYCTSACQSKAWPAHKTLCKLVEMYRDRISVVGKELIEVWGGSTEFERKIGRFWQNAEAHEYCCSRQALALFLVDAAEKTDGYTSNPEAYLCLVEAGKQLMELLRLTSRDNQNLRGLYAFVLLALERVQDAFDLIHWWSTVDPLGSDEHYDWDQPVGFKKGEWMYPRGNNILQELLSDERVSVPPGLDTSFLMALITIKTVIVGQLQSGKKTVKDFENSTGNDTKNTEEGKKKCMQQQWKMLRRYCVMMHRLNPWVLEGIVNPDPYRVLNLPEEFSLGTPEEARVMVKITLKVCVMTGTRAAVKKILPNLSKFPPKKWPNSAEKYHSPLAVLAEIEDQGSANHDGRSREKNHSKDRRLFFDRDEDFWESDSEEDDDEFESINFLDLLGMQFT